MHLPKIEQSSPTDYRLVERATTTTGFSRTDFRVIADGLTLHSAQGRYYDFKQPHAKYQPKAYFAGMWSNGPR